MILSVEIIKEFVCTVYDVGLFTIKYLMSNIVIIIMLELFTELTNC